MECELCKESAHLSCMNNVGVCLVCVNAVQDEYDFLYFCCESVSRWCMKMSTTVSSTLMCENVDDSIVDISC